jgi:hypothetical protein
MKLESINVKTDKKGISSLWINGEKSNGPIASNIARYYTKAKRLAKTNEVLTGNFFQTIPSWDGVEYAHSQIKFVLLEDEPFIVDLRYINKERNINATTLLDFLFYDKGEVGNSEMYSIYRDALRDSMRETNAIKGAVVREWSIYWD